MEFEGIKLSEEIATVLDSKFWKQYMKRLGLVLASKQSDCEHVSEPVLLYRAQGAVTAFKRATTIEVKNTLKDLGISVKDAPRK